MNRKGQTFEIVFIIFFLLIGLLCAVASYSFLSQFTAQTSDVLTGDAADALASTSVFLSLFDYLFLFVFVIYAIIIIGLSVGGRSNPSMFILALILFIPTILFSGTISEFTRDFEDQSSISAYTSFFPISFQVLNNLPLFCVIIFVLGVMVNFLGVGGGAL